jgi:hypothetical protein
MIVGDGRTTLAIRFGARPPAGPGFDGAVFREEIPGAERSLVADLDGDGLADLVLHDPRDRTGALHVLHNRGTLPGSPPRLEPAS